MLDVFTLDLSQHGYGIFLWVLKMNDPGGRRRERFFEPERLVLSAQAAKAWVRGSFRFAACRAASLLGLIEAALQAATPKPERSQAFAAWADRMSLSGSKR